MDVTQMYQEIILNHYKHPLNFGLRVPYHKEVKHVNSTCGDEVTLRVTLTEEKNKILDISYLSQGCSISQASTSILTDLIINTSVKRATEITAAYIKMILSRGADKGEVSILGDGVALANVSLYPARVKCALLGWLAFKDAITQSLEE